MAAESAADEIVVVNTAQEVVRKWLSVGGGAPAGAQQPQDAVPEARPHRQVGPCGTLPVLVGRRVRLLSRSSRFRGGICVGAHVSRARPALHTHMNADWGWERASSPTRRRPG
eukprot:scaffold4343_cov376-Prasinococcus_capsulatus_cf.AAC.1